MSFCFNFDVEVEATDADGDDLRKVKDTAVKPLQVQGFPKPAEPVKEAKEHRPPSDPHFLLADAVPETANVGTLPPLHFLNETVFEKTSTERDDDEDILWRTAAQRSDLISGVYEGGLKVWECTYDLLELMDDDAETFGGKRVLDLGCGAGLLGILALKRGAAEVHFQDYNGTVIEQLTVPNVTLNCQDDDEDEDDEGKTKGRKHNEEENEGEPPPKKRARDAPPQHTLLAKSRFFSGDWSTFVDLVKKEDPPPKYDLIFTSETIYNPSYYPALHDALHKLLAPHGRVYLATKAHYFGVGGGLHLFQTFVAERGVFNVERLWDGEEGLQRHVVGLRFKAGGSTKGSDPAHGSR